MSIRWASSWWWACLVCVVSAVPRGQLGELRLFAPASYDLETAVTLNDVARNDKEVGYKIVATLDVAPVWSKPPTEFLLKFQLRSPKLQLRGKHVLAEYTVHESVWDSHPDSTFYAHWKNGLIQNTYLDPGDVVDILNYKKSLASLFQFQVLDGEYNETDVSGACSALYETISVNVFRKIKRWCAAESGEGEEVVRGARRVARYTLSADLDVLDALYADEIITLGHVTLGVKARAWTRLARRPYSPPGATLGAGGLDAALRSLPQALRPLPLTLEPTPPPDDAEDELDDEELVRALATLGAALEAEGAEEAAQAAGSLPRVLAALRASPRARLAALLARDELHAHLGTVCGALALAGTRAAHAAAADLLQLGARDPLLPLARAYLAALALAPAPDPGVVRDVLRLGEEARARPVADAALLAAAAAAARLERAEPSLAQSVRDALARSLARCKESACRAVRLTALGNLRRADTADLLLQHAERAGPDDTHASVAALHALRAAPPAALSFARLDRLAALALDERAALDVRAAALDLLALRRAGLPAPLVRVAGALHAERGAAAPELRRVLWQRLAALAPRHDEVRRLPALMDPLLRGWDAQAHAGTSSVMVRPTGWALAGWRAELESVQVARGGMLRRGAVTLRAEAEDGAELDALGVYVWVRGLEAFGAAEAGAAEAGDAPPAEDAAAGLALAVDGARSADVPLFEGQAELLGHVWSGAASSPAPVLRALRPLAPARAAVPLLGGAWVAARRDGALALALDASATASLWYRTARGALTLRAGASLQVAGALRTAWGSLAARSALSAAARLHIGAELDFYSGVSLCARVRTAPLLLRRQVWLRSAAGARRLRVSRRRAAVTRVEGRTLSLGRANDATCRTLLSADEDAPDA